MKALNIKLLLLSSILTLQSCSSLNKIIPTVTTQVAESSTYTADDFLNDKEEQRKRNYFKFEDTFIGFDQESIYLSADNISLMIKAVQPELDEKTRNLYANDIFLASTKHKISPQVIVAIIDVESDFQYTKISDTGDLSIGQINPMIWNKEFKWMKKSLIDPNKLTTIEQTYAMDKMAKILKVLEKRHSKKDRRWYARYHSNTPRLKYTYLLKLEDRMKSMAKVKYSNDNNLRLAMGE